MTITQEPLPEAKLLQQRCCSGRQALPHRPMRGVSIDQHDRGTAAGEAPGNRRSRWAGSDDRHIRSREGGDPT